MVLFHAINVYQLISCIAYKKEKFNEKRAVLLISNRVYEKIIEKDILKRFFDTIIEFEIIMSIEKGKGFKLGTKEYFTPLLENENIDIDDFNEIIVGGAHFYFGIFLTENNIPFTFLEDASGMVSRPEILEDINSFAPIRNKKCIENGLYSGNNINVIKVLCNTTVQKEGFKIDNVEHVNPLELLLKWEADDINNLIRVFGNIDKLHIRNNTALILTQHFFNLRLLTFEEQAIIYQLLIDYFLHGYNITLKTHPDDFMFYARILKDIEIVQGKFPSEFLPFLFDNKPDIVATISSTSIFPLKDGFNNILEFSPLFEKTFKLLHRYYYALKMITTKFPKNTNVNVLGCDTNMIQNIIKFSDISNRNLNINLINDLDFIAPNQVYIVDDISLSDKIGRKDIITLLKKLKKNDKVFFINSKQDFCFYHIEEKELFDDIVPIVLKKELIRTEEIYCDDKEEILYFYSKGDLNKEMINKFEAEKQLENAGVIIKKEELTRDKMRIKALEGILKATETRLLHCLEREKELQAELDKYK